MKRSILTIGLGLLLVTVGFGQTTEKETTPSNSQTATHPREVKIKNSVKVEKPAATITIKPNVIRKAEAEAKSEAEENNTEK